MGTSPVWDAAVRGRTASRGRAKPGPWVAWDTKKQLEMSLLPDRDALQ